MKTVCTYFSRYRPAVKWEKEKEKEKKVTESHCFNHNEKLFHDEYIKPQW